MDGGYDYDGYVLCISYQNGYDILAFGGLFSYRIDSKGKERYKYDYSDYSGNISWDDLVNEYLL